MSKFSCNFVFFSSVIFLKNYFGCAGSLAVRASLSLPRVGLLFSGVCRLLTAVAFVAERRLKGPAFSSRDTWAPSLRFPGSRAQAQWLWHRGLAALRPVGSSYVRDRTRVSCIGRQTLYHWATREVPSLPMFDSGILKLCSAHMFLVVVSSWEINTFIIS